MSAWIVSRAHIDSLVLAGVQFGVIEEPTPQKLTALGVDLWAENHRSVSYCCDHGYQAPPYTAPMAEVVLDRVAVVKLVDCIVYQSCEHPAWTGSAAAGYCRRLRVAAMGELPLPHRQGGGATTYPLGWEDAPWGIHHLADAAATTPERESTVDASGQARREGP